MNLKQDNCIHKVYLGISQKERQEVGKIKTTIYFQSKDVLEVLGMISLSLNSSGINWIHTWNSTQDCLILIIKALLKLKSGLGI